MAEEVLEGSTIMAVTERAELAKADILDAQPPEVQETFQFLLATAMHEAGKVGLVSVAEVDGRWHYTGYVLTVLAWL